MVRKKLDERIRTLFQHSIRSNQRSLLVLVGDHGKDQIPNLHQILVRTAETSQTDNVHQASDARIQHSSYNSVLWCYKKELGFSTHRKKRMEKLKRDKKRGLAKQGATATATATAAGEQMDNFELFLTNTNITWCYYKDSHRVLGTTHSLLVLQDFEALTPNIMARTIETVRGGGLVVFLLQTVKSLKQLYAMSMDVHSRYRTESSGDVVPRFNERFILSLGGCANCLVCDDELNILPLSKKSLNRLTKMGLGSQAADGEDDFDESDTKDRSVLSFKSEEDVQLSQLKETLQDTPHVGKLVELTKTLDQARAVLTFLEACADRDKKKKNTSPSPLASALSSKTSTTVSLTAPRGRGKSAALGLCLAGAISFGFNSIVVTAPEPENLVAVFQFLIEGLQALKYQEHYDYTLSYNYGTSSTDVSNNEGEKAGRDNTKCIVSVAIHGKGGQQQRQTVRYVRPRDVEKMVGAELVAIDEAAAIPLPVVRKLMQLNPNHGGKGKSGFAMAGDGEDRRLTFLSSTINGYEGTGRALSLKLIKELRDLNTQDRGGAGAVDAAREASAGIVGASSKKGEAKVHEKRWAAESAAAKATASSAPTTVGYGGPLRELDLSHPIRYSLGDPIETWLNSLLCLNCDSFDYNNTLGKNVTPTNVSNNDMELKGGAPAPAECELYHVNRDALFSYHRLSESFLQKLWGLYTSAHYKNTPNDLQMLSDAPAHNMFVLLGPTAESSDDALPDILAVVQTSLEGKLSRKTIQAQLARGHRSAGDLIPWTMSQQFGDGNFAQLSGARVVRVAVHPSVQGMGYGSRAMELLFRYYNGEMANLSSGEDMNSDVEEDASDEDTPSESESDDEDQQPSGNALLHREALKPRKKLPPLLLPLSALPTPRLDWIGTSFGLTPSLHNFWQRKVGMTLLYLRQTSNDLTGEHSAIMIRALPRRSGWDDAWLPAFGVDAQRRIGRLLGGAFRGMEVSLAVNLLGDVVGGFHSWMKNAGDTADKVDDADAEQKMDKTALQEVKKRSGTQSTKLTASELHYHLTPHDLQRLELYSRNLCDNHLISDLIPSLAQLYFTSRMGPTFRLSSVQSALLCGMGLQHKTVDDLTAELGLPINQTLAMFNKAVKKMSVTFHNLLVEEESKGLLSGEAMKKAEMKVHKIRDVVSQTLEEDVAEAATVAMKSLTQQHGGSGATGTRMAPEIMDPEIMKYALKGTDEDWANAIKEKNFISGDGSSGTTIQVKSSKKTSNKRKAGDQDVLESVLKNEKNMMSSSTPGKKRDKKKTKKQSRKTM
jgi:N-acetyltransferase 10